MGSEKAAGGAGYLFGCISDFVDVVKAEPQQSRQNNVDVVQMIELDIKRRRRQCDGVLETIQQLQALPPDSFGVVRTDADTFTAVNAEFFQNMCFSVPDADRLRRAAFDAIDASAAFFLIQVNGMNELVILRDKPPLPSNICFFRSV